MTTIILQKSITYHVGQFFKRNGELFMLTEVEGCVFMVSINENGSHCWHTGQRVLNKNKITQREFSNIVMSVHVDSFTPINVTITEQ